MKGSCKTCEYFYESECRRFPPMIVHSERNTLEVQIGDFLRYSEFPSVAEDWTCGEYKQSWAEINKK